MYCSKPLVSLVSVNCCWEDVLMYCLKMCWYEQRCMMLVLIGLIFWCDNCIDRRCDTKCWVCMLLLLLLWLWGRGNSVLSLNVRGSAFRLVVVVAQQLSTVVSTSYPRHLPLPALWPTHHLPFITIVGLTTFCATGVGSGVVGSVTLILIMMVVGMQITRAWVEEVNRARAAVIKPHARPCNDSSLGWDEVGVRRGGGWGGGTYISIMYHMCISIPTHNHYN